LEAKAVTVLPFKGAFAVKIDGEVVTRCETEEQANEYAERLTNPKKARSRTIKET
jgi:hypothetical protein